MSIVIKAVGHRLVIKPYTIEENDKRFASAKAMGIVIPDQDARMHQISVDRGTVLEIGPTAFKDFGGEPWCQVGDIIGYTKNAGKFIKINETDHLLVINDEDVVAVLTEKSE
jgi:co-chaperonin GroES (HSP10)